MLNENILLSQVEDFKYRDATNAKSLDRNIMSEKVTEVRNIYQQLL